MKKTYLYICLIVLLSSFIQSCFNERERGTVLPKETDELTATIAQEAFDHLAPELTVTALSNETNIPVFTMWNYAKTYRMGETQVVQSPINVPPTYSYTLGSSDSLSHHIIINTVTFLVAKKEGSGDISFEVVRFTAEDDWLKDDALKVFSLTLSSLEDYTGKILNYDIYGALLDGEVYKNGVKSGIIHPQNKDINVTRITTSKDCYQECIQVYPIDLSRGVGDNNPIDDVIVIGNRPPILPCDYTTWPGGSGGGGGSSGGGGGGGGGNGGGGNTGQGPNPPEPEPEPEPEPCDLCLKAPCACSPTDARVTVSTTLYDVLMPNEITVNVTGKNSNKIASAYILMERVAGVGGPKVIADFFDVSPGQTQFTHTRRSMSPGYWKLWAVINIHENNDVWSNEIHVEEQYPPIPIFEMNQGIRDHLTGVLWDETVNYARANATTHMVAEFGCLIYMRPDGTVYPGETIQGKEVVAQPGAKPTISFPDPDDSNRFPNDPNPRDLVVGTCHTHPPMHWAVRGTILSPGLSPEDKAMKIPGLVYYYQDEIKPGHDLNLPRVITPVGIRRETPR